MKDLVNEGRHLQDNFKNKLKENVFSDLAWAVKADIGNAVMGSSSPGRELFNKWKDGSLYKDKDSPYSKSVSWYDESSIKKNAMDYDNIDKQLGAALKNVSDIKGKVASSPKNPTDDDKQKLAKSKEYLQAFVDYLEKQIESENVLHKLRLSIGMRDKKNPFGLSVPIFDADGNYKGEDKDAAKEDLLKLYPKEWVDEMDMDKPIPVSQRISDWEQKLKDAHDQLSKL
jgi:hypothetical protein